jgi:hypothetical protein
MGLVALAPIKDGNEVVFNYRCGREGAHDPPACAPALPASLWAVRACLLWKAAVCARVGRIASAPARGLGA